MPVNRKVIERGLLVGATLGAVYVATRPRTDRRESGARYVDWARVESAAVGMVRALPDRDLWRRAELDARYRSWVARSSELIVGYTGMSLPAALDSVHVMDREEWIRANLSSFRRLFGRIEEVQGKAAVGDSLAAVLLGEANRQVLSAQLGLLVGYLARRVLGQYDLSLLGKETVEGGRLYFVEPNIARLERELALPADELRFWIALHETTHAYEFEGNSWLRDHFNGLLEQYFEGMNRHIQRFRGMGAMKSVLEGVTRGGARDTWLELLMPEEQRAIFRRLQAVMSLLEGYSNHIMNRVGRDAMASFDLIHDRVEQRRSRTSFADKLFARLTGLSVKMEQYRLGEIFVNQIVDARGIEFMNRVWSSPGTLPSMEEIRSPELWIRRMELDRD